MAGKNPEDVVRRYIQKVKTPPDEVSWHGGRAGGGHRAWCDTREVTPASPPPGLHHLHGAVGHLVGLRGRPESPRHQAGAGGQAGQVWAHVPPAVPRGHVQQRQQGEGQRGHGVCGRMEGAECPLRPSLQDGSLQCPTCKAIYGEKTGTQPPGKMEFHLIPHSLPGYTDSKTIRIVYDIPTGIQVSPPPRGPPPQGRLSPRHLLTPLPSPPKGPEHPNPGKKFTARGFPRHCYLPDNEKGRKVSSSASPGVARVGTRPYGWGRWGGGVGAAAPWGGTQRWPPPRC